MLQPSSEYTSNYTERQDAPHTSITHALSSFTVHATLVLGSSQFLIVASDHAWTSHLHQPSISTPESLFTSSPWFLKGDMDSFFDPKNAGVLAWSRIRVSAHAGWCLWVQACSAIADLCVSPLLVADWCSFSLVPSALLVSPTYV